MVIVVCAPLAFVFGALAALFLLNEFVNGLVPARWFSTNGADWLFGTGNQGSARNYIGFMLTAVPASLFWSAVQWGLSRRRQ